MFSSTRFHCGSSSRHEICQVAQVNVIPNVQLRADVRECHADIVSSRFTRWRRIEKNNTSVLFRTDQSSSFLIVRDFFLQESTVTVISCSLAKCCTTCSVGQSLTILLSDWTINRNLHLHLYLQGKACTHKHCWRTKMVRGTLNNKLKDIEVSFRAAYDILAISHKGFSDFALKKNFIHPHSHSNYSGGFECKFTGLRLISQWTLCRVPSRLFRSTTEAPFLILWQPVVSIFFLPNKRKFLVFSSLHCLCPVTRKKNAACPTVKWQGHRQGGAVKELGGSGTEFWFPARVVASDM